MGILNKIGGIAAAATLASGCDPAFTAYNRTETCLRENVPGALSKVCGPESAAELADYAMNYCGFSTEKNHDEVLKAVNRAVSEMCERVMTNNYGNQTGGDGFFRLQPGESMIPGQDK